MIGGGAGQSAAGAGRQRGRVGRMERDTVRRLAARLGLTGPGVVRYGGAAPPQAVRLR